MNTIKYNTEKPKVMGEFYTMIGRMLSSGDAYYIKEARQYLSYDNPNIEGISYYMKNTIMPALEERDANRKKFAKFMEKELGANWKKELKKQTPVM